MLGAKAKSSVFLALCHLGSPVGTLFEELGVEKIKVSDRFIEGIEALLD
jgi:hypothetical protein